MHSVWEDLKPYLEQNKLVSGFRSCPSTPSTHDFKQSFEGRTLIPNDYETTSLLLAHESPDQTPERLQGAWLVPMRLDSNTPSPIAIRPKTITDGFSKTLAFVERAGTLIYEARPEHHEMGAWPNSVPTDRTDLRHSFDEGVFWHHEQDSDFDWFSGMQINQSNRYGIFAFHEGANMAMCDGSVRFAPEETAPTIIVAAFTKAGREVGREILE